MNPLKAKQKVEVHACRVRFLFSSLCCMYVVAALPPSPRLFRHPSPIRPCFLFVRLFTKNETLVQVVMATSTPDDLFGDACMVANAVGAKSAVAFDLTAACSGFLFALVTASQFLHSGTYK